MCTWDGGLAQLVRQRHVVFGACKAPECFCLKYHPKFLKTAKYGGLGTSRECGSLSVSNRKTFAALQQGPSPSCRGGWEIDESKKEAASRETLEEAGVRGIVEHELGKWNFKSKTHDTHYEGYMFPLLVQEQLDIWPEKNVRQREWMSVDKARKACQYSWMKEALDILEQRLMSQRQLDEEEVAPCSLC
ncbi:NUDIX hydrolase domain - like 10 [Theobroma cacao]|nr:NUDIX hydrolase domain - like 10 [Theobroma cacao]WRX22264.1 NUDIX hydrolase domain - like 10 [Theobroma cacao]